MYGMPAPQKSENKKTTLCVTKSNKQKLRRYARLSKTRKGYESDDEILTRLFKKLETVMIPGTFPKQTYDE